MATKTCLFCAEEIQEEAIKCKHCGERLDHPSTASPSPEPSSVEAPAPPPMPWYQKGWDDSSLQKGWVIFSLLFLVFPLGVILLWKKKESYSFNLKVIATVCFGLFFITILISGGDQESPTEPSFNPGQSNERVIRYDAETQTYITVPGLKPKSVPQRQPTQGQTKTPLGIRDIVKLRWPSWFTLSLKSWNESLYPALQQKDNAAIYKMFEDGVVQELPAETWIEIQQVGPTFYVVKIRQAPIRKERVGWEVYVPHDIVFER